MSPGNQSKVILGGGYPAFYPRPDDIPKKPLKEVGIILHFLYFSLRVNIIGIFPSCFG